jgi:type IV secretion system protein VirB6
VACPAVTTGAEFLTQTLSHLDCQAQMLGSFGFQSLAAPGSPAGAALAALLTLFIALYGIRLLFGPGDEPRDIIGAVLKIGIVLTIAVSWPAWRTLAYDTVLHGPAEIATSIMPSTVPDPGNSFARRLQAVDAGIATLTQTGTGRQTGEIIEEGPTSGFRQVALTDEAGLGWARSLYLAATIGSLAALRIAAGLLLALAPLMAGLLLFDVTRGLFAGWLRGLALVALGSLGLTVLLSVQVAVMEPWLADVLERRSLGYATPTAPTELLALVTGFAIAAAALMFILAKVAFQNAWATNRPALARFVGGPRTREALAGPAATTILLPVHSRAAAISESVATQIRREETEAGGERIRRIGVDRGSATTPAHTDAAPALQTPLGSGYHRTVRTGTHSQQRRDQR